jgi:transcriptional regulator with XRE-family HTH domain
MAEDTTQDHGQTAPRRYRVTSFDVAAEAGVSQSTVSRALAGDPVVSEATRARVAAAAAKLKYHVDENAARLRTGKTGTLAVVVVVRPVQDMKDFNPSTSRCWAASAPPPPRAGTTRWSASRAPPTSCAASIRSSARPTA